MEFLDTSPASIERAACVILDGGLVSFPTETVYGLGADAFNAMAIAKIFQAKGRPLFDPLIIHIAASEMLEEIADFSALSAETREKLHILASNLWPGPLSLVLPKNKRIPDLATAGLGTMAVRLPDHPAAAALISKSSGAVAAPSANPFGFLSPTCAAHVRDMLGEKVDVILDGGPARIGVESTVVDLCLDSVKILRPGGATREAIEKLIGPVADASTDGNLQESPSSPGMLKSHYAPVAKLSVFSNDQILSLDAGIGDAVLFFDGKSRDRWLDAHGGSKPGVIIRELSETGDPAQAAANLFQVLHELDRAVRDANTRQLKDMDFMENDDGKAGLHPRIFAQTAPETGLGAAINDRLRRAGSEK